MLGTISNYASHRMIFLARICTISIIFLWSTFRAPTITPQARRIFCTREAGIDHTWFYQKGFELSSCYSTYPSSLWTGRLNHSSASYRTPYCVWGWDCMCNMEPSSSPHPDFRPHTQTSFPRNVYVITVRCSCILLRITADRVFTSSLPCEPAATCRWGALARY